MTQVLIAGDFHGDPNHAGRIALIARDRGIKTIFQVGDFGYWPHTDRFVENLSDLLRKWGLRLVFCDGNHEAFRLSRSFSDRDLVGLLDMEDRVGRSDEGFWMITDTVQYAPRGLRWRWNDYVFLAMGGANSIDKEWRQAQEEGDGNRPPQHLTYWWPEELITDQDIKRALTCDDPDLVQVQVVLSHDMPTYGDTNTPIDLIQDKTSPDDYLNRRYIKDLLIELRPNLLIHGHYHRYCDRLWRAPDGYPVRLIGLGCNEEKKAKGTYTIIETYRESQDPEEQDPDSEFPVGCTSSDEQQFVA